MNEPQNVQDLKDKIVSAFSEVKCDTEVLRRVNETVLKRARLCLEKNGLHFEHLLSSTMSFPFIPFASSSYSASYSRSYTNREIEDSDSDERTYRQPAKPRAQKKPTQKKTLKTREDYIEKIEHFACRICHKTYTNKGSLTRHLTTFHGLDKDAKKPKATAMKSQGNRAPSRAFRCKVCRRELSSNASLIRHMATQHDKACESKPKKTKVSKTNVYLNVFNNYTSYNNGTPSQSMDMAVRRNNYDSY